MDGSNWVKSKRQEYLQKWGFECNCPACEDTPEGRDKEEKRLAISLLSGDLEDLLNLDTEESPEESLKLTQRLAAMQKSAGLVGRESCFSYVICSSADPSSADIFQLLLRGQTLHSTGRCKNGFTMGRERAGG